ncbi:MAG: DUF5777 family beta-barrel protein [Flavobacteriaceae bacterium]|nr:DUF5777 family beta-barrel protein [Flavobacteriaceae bacterium]
MKNIKLILVLLMALPMIVLAQDKKEVKKDKPERAAFDHTWIISGPTNVLYKKGTLQFDMMHRFGTVNGTNDMLGFWAPANIRLGLNYSFTDYLTLGLGTTKNNRMVDFNARVALLRQTRSGKIPVSVSYYGNFSIDTRLKDNFLYNSDRYSFYSTIIIAKRFTKNISLQIAPNYSHYNVIDKNMQNDQFSISLAGRSKISPQTALLAFYNQPLTQHNSNQPYAGFGLGFEFSTGAHAFQVFAGNYKGIMPQKNSIFNQNQVGNGDILIGFNITRLWNF